MSFADLKKQSDRFFDVKIFADEKNVVNLCFKTALEEVISSSAASSNYPGKIKDIFLCLKRALWSML